MKMCCMWEVRCGWFRNYSAVLESIGDAYDFWRCLQWKKSIFQRKDREVAFAKRVSILPMIQSRRFRVKGTHQAKAGLETIFATTAAYSATSTGFDSFKPFSASQDMLNRLSTWRIGPNLLWWACAFDFHSIRFIHRPLERPCRLWSDQQGIPRAAQNIESPEDSTRVSAPRYCWK